MTRQNVDGEPLEPFTLVGDRVTVRPWTIDDVGAVEEASADDLIPLITTVPNSFAPDAGEAFIRRQNHRLTSGEGWAMAIDDHDLGRAVGHIGLWVAQLHKGRADLGYWVLPSARQRRVAVDALTLVGDWAFDHLVVHRLSLFIEPWNTASIRTAERAGYRREALLHHWQIVDGQPRDMWVYARLRDGAHHDGIAPA